MIQDISAAKAKAASGVKPAGPQAGDPVMLEQEAAAREARELTVRLRAARLANEVETHSAHERLV